MVKNIFAADADYQWLQVLRDNRNKRHASRAFLVEGVRNINFAVSGGWHIQAWVYCRDRVLSGWAEELLKKVPAHRYILPEHLMSDLSGREHTSELLAIVDMPEDNLSRIPLPGNKAPLVVVFDRPSNKGNLGTLIRSSDAMGADGLITTGHCVDLYDRETILATMGSFFVLPSVHLESLAALETWYGQRKAENPDWQIVGTSAHGTADIEAVELTRPTLLLIGNETEGLSKRLKEMADTLAMIPMSSAAASSMNVACAATVLLYETARQRRKAH